MVFKWFQKKAKRLFSNLSSDRPLVNVENDGFMSDEISVSIEDILSAEKEEDVGKLHILSLTEFKTALGDLWEKRRGKIYILTESVLRAEIGAGNHWENPSPKTYIMLFPQLNEAEADARAYEIAEEVGRKIIGDRFEGGKRPNIRVAGVEPKDALKEDGTLDLEKIEEAGENGISAGPQEPDMGDQSGAHKSGPNLQEGSSKISGQDQKESDLAQNSVDPNWKKKKHDSAETDPSDWQKNQSQNADEGDPDWQKNKGQALDEGDPDWQKNQRAGAQQRDANWVEMEHEPKNDRGSALLEDHYQPILKFYPCWEKKSQSLRLYRSTLYIEKNQEYLRHGLDAYSAWHGSYNLAQKDLWVLKQTARALFAHTRKEIITPVFVPIHVTTLVGNNLTHFTQILEKFTPELREKYLILELITTKGFALESLEPAFEALSKLQVKTALLGQDEHFEKLPEKATLDYAGIDLATSAPEEGFALEAIDAISQILTEKKIAFYVFGITQRADLGDMLTHGADVINGPALVRMTDKLRPPFALPAERFQGK